MLTATESVLALHAADPATVYLSAAARLADPDHANIEAQLYDRTTLLRMTAMRGTLFVLPTSLVPAVLASLGREHADQRRRVLARHVESAGLGAGWLDGVTRKAIADTGAIAVNLYGTPGFALPRPPR